MEQNKNLKKNIWKYCFILFFALLILLLLSIIFTLKYQDIIYYHVSSPDIVSYDKFMIHWHEDVDSDDEEEMDPRDLFLKKCLYLNSYINTCHFKILSWNQEEFVYQKKDYVSHYYVKNKKQEEIADIDLTGLFFQNKEYEFYFLNPEFVIVAGKNIYQKKYRYRLVRYHDEYLDLKIQRITSEDRKGNHPSFIPVGFESKYTYHEKTQEILGFQKVKKKNLKYLEDQYYDQNGNLNSMEQNQANGCYQYVGEERAIEIKELCVMDHKVLFSYPVDNKIQVETDEWKWIDQNQTKLYYSMGFRGGVDFYYVLNENSLCLREKSCYQKMNITHLKTISVEEYEKVFQDELNQEKEDEKMKSAIGYYQNNSNIDTYHVIYEAMITENYITMYIYDIEKKEVIEKQVDDISASSMILYEDGMEVPPIAGKFYKVDKKDLKSLSEDNRYER